MNSTKIRKYTYTISILLHILFLLSFKPLSNIRIFNTIPEAVNMQEQEKQIKFELVETPDYAPDEPPDDATALVSDKSTRARDQYTAKDREMGLPFSSGDLEQIRDIVINTNPSHQQQSENLHASADANYQFDNSEIESADRGASQKNFDKFSRQALISGETASEQTMQRPEYNNDKFNAKEIGGLSFNTYDWNYAPYLLAMKRKVERNIFPPPAFTHMGLIDGETILRFKIYPNGEIRDLEVLEYKGHKSLMETSVQAIRNASPFNPLPADFPENYLEVTGHFTYYIKGR
ncbi:energy transducer TonB [candidate division KSB1 bacterium]|nr:energy transducer TonB [candidate division KSB1 bacterium]